MQGPNIFYLYNKNHYENCFRTNLGSFPVFTLCFAFYNDISFPQEMKENKVINGHIFAREPVGRMMI